MIMPMPAMAVERAGRLDHGDGQVLRDEVQVLRAGAS